MTTPERDRENRRNISLERRKRFSSNVLEAAAGHWDYVLRNLAPEYTRALDNLGKHVPCPSHGGKDGFRFFKDEKFHDTGAGICNTCHNGKVVSGLDLIMAQRNWKFVEAVDEIGRLFSMTFDKTSSTSARPVIPNDLPPPPQLDLEGEQRRREKARAKIARVLSGCQQINWHDSPQGRYLCRRGLVEILDDPPSADVLAHPALPYYVTNKLDDGKFEFKRLGYFPAMIAVIRNHTGEIVNLHRYYLREDGYKADVPTFRKEMMFCGDFEGAATQLYPGRSVIATGEGLETLLAVRVLLMRAGKSDVGIWTALNATMLEKFVPPPDCQRLLIYADRDSPQKNAPLGRGEEAARQLAARVPQNIRTQIFMPKQVDTDWLNFLNDMTGHPGYQAPPFRGRAADQEEAAPAPKSESAGLRCEPV